MKYLHSLKIFFLLSDKIYEIMYGLPWMLLFVPSEVIWQWFSRVMKSQVKIIAESLHEWQKTVFMVAHTLFYFLHAILCLIQHTNLLKQSSIVYFAIFTVNSTFWLGIVKPPQFYLWRHTYARYWHCDVIFIDFSCAHKFVQKWSSLVNSNCEYQHLKDYL